MPCWYFERKEIKYSPSFNDGIDSNSESRYRREGARFIIDAGTKMGLRYDTCATGVVYFHRFYMFHSFKEYYRYVTAACCLLLAGKVEETPKKCKDIIRIAQSLLSPTSFARFGEDPREEIMQLERVLLKTIKFDFQVDHPYSYMLKYAKMFKGDKEKTQKMAQMAWTFINDSLCTTLALQWEPEIVAVSLMYLASRLTKFEPTEWSGRSSSKSKWWEDIIEGMSMELMEDICHQVLDLYSKQKKSIDADSPPQSPAKSKHQTSPPPPPPPDKPPAKRIRESTPSEPEKPPKVTKLEDEGSRISTIHSKPSDAPNSMSQHISVAASSVGYPSAPDAEVGLSAGGSSDGRTSSRASTDYAAYNPYVSSQMYSSSFMSLEGSQNIQSILAGTSGPPPPSSGPPPSSSVSVPPAATYTDVHHPHHPPPASHLDMTNYPPVHVSDPQYGYTPPAPGPSEQTSYNYPPPSVQYGAHLAGTIPGSHPPPPAQSHYPPPPVSGTSGPPPGYDPYSAPPPSTNLAASAPYHGGPSSYPPDSSAPQSSQNPYTATTVPPPQGYSGAPYYPGSTMSPLVPGMNQVSGYPSSNYPPPGGSQGASTHSHPQSYGGGGGGNYGSGGGGGGGGQSRHRGNYHRPKHQQRKDIPALTDIKITGRPEWGN